MGGLIILHASSECSRHFPSEACWPSFERVHTRERPQRRQRALELGEMGALKIMKTNRRKRGAKEEQRDMVNCDSSLTDLAIAAGSLRTYDGTAFTFFRWREMK